MAVKPKKLEDIEGILDLSAFSPAVAGRVALLNDRDVDFGDGVKVSKKCIFDVLPILENTDDRIRAVFAAEIMCTKPSEVSSLKNDSELKDLVKALGYQGGNPLWDQSIHYIIDQGVEVTTDNQVIFNPEAILRFLDISEVSEMRRVHSQRAGINAIVDERVAAQKRGRKPEIA